MWRLIGLFSLILATLFAQGIRKDFEVNLELTGRAMEEKPRLSPPLRIEVSRERELDLSWRLLEPPKVMEFAQLPTVERSEGISCGEPKDALSFRLGVEYMQKNRLDLAKEELSKVVMQVNSPYRPMAQYLLGRIAYSERQDQLALNLFRESCSLSHIYQGPACEASNALEFMLGIKPSPAKDPFWSFVNSIRDKKPIKNPPECTGVTFTQYCSYVRDFVLGKENQQFRDSTRLRNAIIAFQNKNFQQARAILEPYAQPGSSHRAIALYYLALIEHFSARHEDALKKAAILSTIDQSLAVNLYEVISSSDFLLARLTYSLTGDRKFLQKAGAISYNRGDYDLALSNFLQAGDSLNAAFAAINKGDYQRAAQILEQKPDKTREEYMWLLESLYWSNLNMSKTLSEIQRLHPELAREYSAWELFRKGDYQGALQLFIDPYHRALALFNLRRYQEVIQLLSGRQDQNSRILVARAMLSMGDTSGARGILSDRSPPEAYLIGVSYFIEGKFPQSAQIFESIPPNSPIRPKALIRAADAYFNAGNQQRARDLYLEVLRSFPDTQEARQSAMNLLQMGKTVSQPDAEKPIREYLSRTDSKDQLSQELRYQLANIYLEQGREKEAERELLALIETPLKYRAILKLAQIEKDINRRLVLYYTVYKESPIAKEREEARSFLIEIYSSIGDKDSLASLLLEGTQSDRARALLMFISSGDLKRARSVAQELMASRYRDPQFEFALMELYQKTRERQFLEYLKSSQERSIRAKALYLSALENIKAGKKSQALEELVEISMGFRGEEVYNQAIIEGAKILIAMGSKKDASCLLERFDASSAKREELQSQESLKKGLPRCERQ